MLRSIAAPRLTALAVVACIMLLPGGGALLRQTDPDLSYENRNAARWPAGLSLSSELLREYQEFFRDRLGWRGDFIALRNQIYDAFGLSPNPLARAGNDRWLLTTANSALLDRAGLVRFDGETVRRYQSQIAARVDFWRRRGIQYYLLLGPDKSSIYPERLNRHFPIGETAFEQVYRAHGPGVFGPRFVDPRDVLRQEKSELTYYEADSHWNVLGARLAYRQLVAAIAKDFPNVNSVPDSSYAVGSEPFKGDLVPYGLEASYAGRGPFIEKPTDGCGTRAGLTTENWPRFGLKTDSSITKCPTRKLNALVVHDSFGLAIQPLLARTFANTIFVAMPALGDIPGELVEEAARITGPIDIVIQVRVERAFMTGRMD